MHARNLQPSDANLLKASNTAHNFLRNRMSLKTLFRASSNFEILNGGYIITEWSGVSGAFKVSFLPGIETAQAQHFVFDFANVFDFVNSEFKVFNPWERILRDIHN